jgi:ribonucleoside-diphosphate reductase alpha chain
MRKELLDYFDGDELAASVWEGKYALEGEVTPEDMHRRIAREIARVEKTYKQTPELDPITWNSLSHFGRHLEVVDEDFIFKYLDKFRYIIPQGSIMSGLGNEKIQSLSNCFVLPSPEDSYGGIFKTDQELVQLEKRRGGVGFNLNSLRPEGVQVNNSAKTSTGAHSFMDRFSNSTREVAQGGRRGALMLLMDCRHPDIFKFVEKKKDRTKVTGANISVMLTDKFMKAVENKSDFICRFPVDFEEEYIWSYSEMATIEYNKLVNLDVGLYVMKIRAVELFDLIVQNAWDNAEPGVAFIDRVQRYCPEGVYEQYRSIASNPCGEQWLQAYDACRLLALNLFNIVKNPFTDKSEIDWDKLYEIAYVQQRLADDIVDLEVEYIERIICKIKCDPESENVKRMELDMWDNILRVAQSSRRTGCGFTGMGDMLAALGLKYDSDEAISIIEQVTKKKMEAELDCTIDLAILRGSFEGWNKELEKVK